MEFNGTFLATIVTFILFVFLMNKVLYAPILDIMEKRRTFIDENFKNTEENNQKAAELTKEKEDKLIDAKNDARKKYLEQLEDYKNQRADIISDAQDASKNKLESSDKELENVSNELKNGLKSKMTTLAEDIAEKVLGYRTEIKEFDNSIVDDVLYK